jgi:hypothetical protein
MRALRHEQIASDDRVRNVEPVREGDDIEQTPTLYLSERLH